MLIQKDEQQYHPLSTSEERQRQNPPKIVRIARYIVSKESDRKKNPLSHPDQDKSQSRKSLLKETGLSQESKI